MSKSHRHDNYDRFERKKKANFRYNKRNDDVYMRNKLNAKPVQHEAEDDNIFEDEQYFGSNNY